MPWKSNGAVCILHLSNVYVLGWQLACSESMAEGQDKCLWILLLVFFFLFGTLELSFWYCICFSYADLTDKDDISKRDRNVAIIISKEKRGVVELAESYTIFFLKNKLTNIILRKINDPRISSDMLQTYSVNIYVYSLAPKRWAKTSKRPLINHSYRSCPSHRNPRARIRCAADRD